MPFTTFAPLFDGNYVGYLLLILVLLEFPRHQVVNSFDNWAKSSRQGSAWVYASICLYLWIFWDGVTLLETTHEPLTHRKAPTDGKTNACIPNFVTGWWFGTLLFFSSIYWEESSQLTNSYFSEGRYTTNQVIHILRWDGYTHRDNSVAPVSVHPCWSKRTHGFEQVTVGYTAW